MMARASSDPFWRAKVKSESRIAGEAIEDKCLRCHAPAQHRASAAAGRNMRLRDLSSNDEGVTCTVCHRIADQGLGTAGSFTGQFQLDGQQRLFGPHAKPFTMPMEHHTGFRPAESAHVLEAAFCGTCHTVITHDVISGKPFLEQAPYLEWLASAYGQSGTTCQSCHEPVLAAGGGRRLRQYIAHRPGGGVFPPTQARLPFGLHIFAGGNAWIPDLTPNPDERSRGRTMDMLARSATLAVQARRSGGGIELAVRVFNRTGHKLPTGYGSRRLWLHVRVTGAGGRVVFESGAWNPDTGELLAQPYQDHRQLLDSADQVMVYEAEYQDAEGKATQSLARAAAFRKDNRILPDGFDLARIRVDGIDADQLRPVGTQDDPDFVPGSDTVRYRVPADGAAGFEVLVEACFQSVKPSHLEWLRENSDRETTAFTEALLRRNAPVVIARQVVHVAP